MTDIFANDLFEIHGTHISISSITDFRLKEIEFIMQPVYYEEGRSKWAKWMNPQKHNIVFEKMDYYAAIIGEENYKNAIEEAKAKNIFEAAFQTAAVGIGDALSGLIGKPSGQKTKYRIMKPSGNIMEKTFSEIPAMLHREDGKQSEVFPDDELYPFLGEAIAPTIVTVPALFIYSKDGKYVFFGNGIHIDNVEQEYERLKLAIKVVKEIKQKESIEKKDGQNLIESLLGQISLPFISLKSKEQEEIICDAKKDKK